MKRTTLLLYIVVILMILSAIGCSSDENSKIAQLATDYAQQQAAQSKRVLEIQKELAAGSRSLVEADALARKEMAVMQREFQTERLQLAQSYDQLEVERRTIAKERNRAPIVAAAIANIGMIIVCLMPMLLCLMLLSRKPVEDEQGMLNEFVLENVFSQAPLLSIPSLQATHSNESSVGESLTNNARKLDATSRSLQA